MEKWEKHKRNVTKKRRNNEIKTRNDILRLPQFSVRDSFRAFSKGVFLRKVNELLARRRRRLTAHFGYRPRRPVVAKVFYLTRFWLAAITKHKLELARACCLLPQLRETKQKFVKGQIELLTKPNIQPNAREKNKKKKQLQMRF